MEINVNDREKINAALMAKDRFARSSDLNWVIQEALFEMDRRGGLPLAVLGTKIIFTPGASARDRTRLGHGYGGLYRTTRITIKLGNHWWEDNIFLIGVERITRDALTGFDHHIAIVPCELFVKGADGIWDFERDVHLDLLGPKEDHRLYAGPHRNWHYCRGCGVCFERDIGCKQLALECDPEGHLCGLCEEDVKDGHGVPDRRAQSFKQFCISKFNFKDRDWTRPEGCRWDLPLSSRWY